GNQETDAPVQVGTGTSWASIAAGYDHTCATRSDGSLWCWGRNFYGQLGDGTTTDRSVPNRVGLASNWASVAAGEAFTCATRTDGSIWCWGYNQLGQLGDG